MKAVIFSDGGSRGNPGKAAIGYVIKKEDGDAVYECGMNIGTATNNTAEYKAVIEALKMADSMGYIEVEVYLDSQLVEKQIKGEYRVKSLDLIPLFTAVISELKRFKKYSVTHVKRELNKRADKLVNEALDSDNTVIYDYRITENENLQCSNSQSDKTEVDKVKALLKKNKTEFVDIKALNQSVVITLKISDAKKIENILDDLKSVTEKSKIKNLLFEII